MANPPPPEYSLESSRPNSLSLPAASSRSAEGAGAGAPVVPSEHLQVLITPASDATDFQNGALGVEGEHATVEGEVQIKGAVEGAWQRVSITFQTIEMSPTQTVELAHVTQVLYLRTPPSESSSRSTIPPLPSSLPFAIPLQPDAPECVHTPSSSLTHYLLVQLLPIDTLTASFEHKIPIHLRRYSTASNPFLPILPHELTIQNPVPVSVQLPRLEFRVGEPIPVYITVPPPDRQQVQRTGLRLRNVKAELVRVVALTDGNSGEDVRTPTASSEAQNPLGEGSSTTYAPFFSDKKTADPAGFAHLGSLIATGDDAAQVHTSVMSRSGAACRFHSSRPVRVRLVLHPFSLSAEITASGRQPHSVTQGQREADGCATITQTTLLHSVSFHLVVRVGLISAADRGEVSVEQVLPLTLVAGLAPVEEDMTAGQYSKKHDAPPERTYRYDSEDAPSLMVDGTGAAPPFSAYDPPRGNGIAAATTPDVSAPPPFFSDLPSSSQPPSFLEAQSSYAVGPSTSAGMGMGIAEWSTSDPVQTVLRIPGEGEVFGFAYEDVYDGFGDGSRTPPPPPPPLTPEPSDEPPPLPPPPTMSMDMGEVDVDGDDVDGTQFNQLLSHTAQRIQAMMDRSTGADAGGEAPPPPPAMDDPMDPPPAIDDAFRPVLPHRARPAEPSARARQAGPPTPPPPHEDAEPVEAVPPQSATEPPPYLVAPAGGHEHEHADHQDGQDGHGPPPYSDFAGGPPAPL